jgi:hypothetical protein
LRCCGSYTMHLKLSALYIKTMFKSALQTAEQNKRYNIGLKVCAITGVYKPTLVKISFTKTRLVSFLFSSTHLLPQEASKTSIEQRWLKRQSSPEHVLLPRYLLVSSVYGAFCMSVIEVRYLRLREVHIQSMHTNSNLDLPDRYMHSA